MKRKRLASKYITALVTVAALVGTVNFKVLASEPLGTEQEVFETQEDLLSGEVEDTEIEMDLETEPEREQIIEDSKDFETESDFISDIDLCGEDTFDSLEEAVAPGGKLDFTFEYETADFYYDVSSGEWSDNTICFSIKNCSENIECIEKYDQYSFYIGYTATEGYDSLVPAEIISEDGNCVSFEKVMVKDEPFLCANISDWKAGETCKFRLILQSTPEISEAEASLNRDGCGVGTVRFFYEIKDN